MSSEPNLPLPANTDIKLYEHLTQKERMLAGFPFTPFDTELTRERFKSRKLCDQFNALEADDFLGKQKILDELLHPDSRGKNLIIESSFRTGYGYNLSFGNNTIVNFDCVFLDSGRIVIGDHCLIGPGVHIYAGNHPVNPKYRCITDKEYYQYTAPVTLGNNVWIGGKATICPGVTIGENAVVGAGSIVTKDVPANTVVAGNPAKIIRDNVNIA